MGKSITVFCLLFFSVAAFAQNDRGTITGTVLDPANAVVPNANVVAINASGVEFKTVSTGTGNYTIPSLPAGVYKLTVDAAGFKKFAQENIQVQVSQSIRIDANLQVGSATDTVTITAEAPLLKTENAEQSTVVSTDMVNKLPLNFGGGGSSTGAVRDPFAFNILSPGVVQNTSLAGSDYVQINGIPASGFGMFRVQVEGQDATSSNDPNWTSTVSHGSVDMIQEFSLQTSNFAAEYGQAAGGYYNFTTKSGTNQIHGSAYEYLTNEDLDAYRPFTYTNPRSRKHDFGGTISGPVWIPKLYNGKNRTFFFFSEVTSEVLIWKACFSLPARVWTSISSAMENSASLPIPFRPINARPRAEVSPSCARLSYPVRRNRSLICLSVMPIPSSSIAISAVPMSTFTI
jgi:hypothetical protein